MQVFCSTAENLDVRFWVDLGLYVAPSGFHPGNLIMQNSYDVVLVTYSLGFFLLPAASITRRDLDWYNSPTTQGVALGPSFEYSNKALKVKVGGLYCVYAQMNITRLGSYSAEEAVDASLLIRRHTASSSSSTVLTLPLDLSRRSYETVTLFKAVPYRLEKDDRLQVTIEASENASKYGFLNSRNSFFGLFQILDTVPM